MQLTNIIYNIGIRKVAKRRRERPRKGVKKGNELKGERKRKRPRKGVRERERLDEKVVENANFLCTLII